MIGALLVCLLVAVAGGFAEAAQPAGEPRSGGPGPVQERPAPDGGEENADGPNAVVPAAGPQADAGNAGANLPGPGGPNVAAQGGSRDVAVLAWGQYMPGDSPRDEQGRYIWLLRESAAGWNRLPFDPARLGPAIEERTSWFRVHLGAKDNPYLLFDRSDFSFELYSGLELVYTHGTPNDEAPGRLNRDRMLFVKLPDGVEAKPLFVRVRTDDASVLSGKMGKIQYGPEAELKLQIVRNDALNLAALLVFFIIGALSLMLALIHNASAANIYFALSSLLISLNLLISLRTTGLFVDTAVFHDLLRGALPACAAYCAGLYFVNVFRTRFEKLIIWLMRAVLAYGALALLGSWLFPAAFVPGGLFSALTGYGLSAICLTCLILIVRSFRAQTTSDARWFAAGVSLFLLIQALGYPLRVWIEANPGFFPFAPHQYALAFSGAVRFSIFFSILFFGVISFRRYSEVHRTMRAYNAALEAKNAELRKMDELKDHFLANTSHELRTPLHGIIGLSETLADGAAGRLPREAADHLRMIAASGKRLASLVDDILDFSRLKHEEIRLTRRTVDMRALTDVVLETLRPLSAHKALRMINEVPADCLVNADEGRIQQILFNLLGNAIKFSERGTVAVGASGAAGGSWRIAVTDEGIGIAADQLERIFESFVQADGSTARDYGGTGLGLSISKRLVELHGGALIVDSAPGCGSKFAFTLPAAATRATGDAAAEAEVSERSVPALAEIAAARAAADAADGYATEEAGAAAAAGDRASSTASARILIVDDEPINLQVLRNYLEMEGHSVVQAADGPEALALLEAGERPDLIVLDVMMPRMSGFELCRTIRGRFETRGSLPILMLTAKNQLTDLVEGFDSGANDYVAKPVSRGELIARIRLHLQLAEWNQSLERRVRERTDAIQNLLDSAGQGFLSIDSGLLVQEEYSAECVRLFGEDIAGRPFETLLYPSEERHRSELRELLEMIFDEADDMRREVCLSLLPRESDLFGGKAALQYKWIPAADGGSAPARLMAIATDISERKRLETRVERERQTLRMVVRVVAYYRDYKEAMDEYRRFAGEALPDLLRTGGLGARKVWSEVYRRIHTFKGNFAQLDFVHLPHKLHELENRLEEWRSRMEEEGADEDDFLAGVFVEWLRELPFAALPEDDLGLLRGTLGERFEENGDTVTIARERLQQLERTVAEILPGDDAKAVIRELKKLQHLPFSELMKIYPDYTQKLAERTGKKIRPFRIEGGGTIVNPERYAPLVRSFIHIFRNMLDHGIESPADRASFGKAEAGTIVCRIRENEGHLELTFGNDGRPVDPEQIRDIAVRQGLTTAADFDAMPRGEQLRFIFHERFTTQHAADELSGRGIGLSAVRTELERLNGGFELESSPERGTVFRFCVPLDSQ